MSRTERMGQAWLHPWVKLLVVTLSASQTTAARSGYSDADGVFLASSLLNETVCPSKQCQNLSSQILGLMDHTAGPCEDFYRHACGGLRSSPEMLERDPDGEVDRRLGGQIEQIKTSPRSFVQLKKFYDSCKSFEKVQNEGEARSVVATVGVFHSKDSWTANSSDLTDLLANLLAVGSTTLFDIQLDVSDEDPTRFDLKLVAPMRRSLLLPDTDACLAKQQPSSQHVYTECRQRNDLNFIASVAEALQAVNIFPADSADVSANDFQATIYCLQDIINIIEKYTPFESDVRRDLAMKNYNYMNITELQDKFPLINWMKLLNSIVHQVPADTKVQVYFEYYFTMLFRHLSEVETRLLHNSLLAMFVTGMYSDVIDHDGGDRDRYCLVVTKTLLPDVSAALYLRTFGDHVATQVRDVFGQVKRALEAQVARSGWLDEPSRRAALERLRALGVVAGGGAELLADARVLDRRMEDYSMNENEFLRNSIHLLRRNRKLTYALYTKKTSGSEQTWTYFANTLDTTEPIDYKGEQIVVQYATLPDGRLGEVMPQFKIAEVGMILAKMIGHHFDSTGINRTANGVDGILSEDQAKKYSSLKECVWKQVSKLDRAVIKHRRDVQQTVMDVIAEQIALNVALEAFKTDNRTIQKVLEDSSWEQKGLQLFFLAVAQTSCTKTTTWDSPAPVYQRIMLPPSARINLLFSQSEAFSKAFGCSLGSGMKPPEEDICPTFPEGCGSMNMQHTLIIPTN
ncbi:endothelin-converting enzyme homolog isoform X2 [Bacillus rossius redtenbacheri]|uniref:endothelin-converting enzyme homolog isoform X2 n=1 Tax=Bacillus rossius redtenbacheri TaxID=93214 RepID=UPI002FDDEFA3